jgi:hypothetical protein
MINEIGETIEALYELRGNAESVLERMPEGNSK